jgi:hypothetical protein
MPSKGIDLGQYIGREPERLTLDERQQLAGNWIALQIYSPATLPLKRMEAVGSSVGDCVSTLRKRGLDPRQFEYTLFSALL